MLYRADALRKLYPDHSLVMTSDWRLQLLSFPGVSAEPIEAAPLVTEVVFIPLARRLGGPLGMVADSVEIGTFKVTWEVSMLVVVPLIDLQWAIQGYEFIVYITQVRWLLCPIALQYSHTSVSGPWASVIAPSTSSCMKEQRSPRVRC